MKMSIAPQKHLEKHKVDLMIVGVFAADNEKKEALALPKTFQSIDAALDGQLMAFAQAEGFFGKTGQSFATRTLAKTGPKCVALIGLGAKDRLSVDSYRRAAAQAFRLANDKRAQTVAIAFSIGKPLETYDTVKACAEGVHLARYRFDKYLTENKPEIFVKELSLLVNDIDENEEKKLLHEAKVIAESVCCARDLINEGPMEIHPEKLAALAQKEGKALGLDVQVLDEKALAKENMNLMLAVAKGALEAAPPRLIRMAYRPLKKAKKHVVLVGKGVTFDSGGLDIKTAEGMLDMKIDMSGAAAVFATLLAVAQLKPNVAVTGYLACVENGISAYAYHPGDIIKSRRGLCIEINNTDAEGRLILADALDYAQSKDKPDFLIDIATLTGASMVALGLGTASIFSTSDKLSDQIIHHGKKVGENFWRMPLNEDLRDQLKSTVADMKNSGGRYGGSITGALFLKKFVNDNIPWAHLDIAGPANNDKDHLYLTKGGVGFGVRTLSEFICQL